MTRLSQFFVENPKFTFVISIAVFVFGISGLFSINSESFPTVNIGTVVITTYYKGATASDIETKITKPLEEEIRSVSGIKKVVSSSQAGLSRIVTAVDIDKYDVKEVIADLQRSIDRATGLPVDLDQPPAFTEIKSEEFPVIELAVFGPNQDRLRDRAADLLKEEIEDNKKVSNVLITGFRDRQFNIYLDQKKLETYHVAVNEVMGAIANRNVTIPGGELKSDREQKLLRIEGKALSREQIENIIVRSNYSGQKIKVKTIARVEDSQEDPVTLARYDGKEATLLTISKKGGADLIALAREIESLIEDFRRKYDGQLEFTIFNNEGFRVKNRIGVLSSNALMGLGLVIFFLLLFLPGIVGIVTAISLPIALLATLGMIYAMGFTINTVTILGMVIAIGMLVDNAIVISENFVRLREEGFPSREAVLKTIRDLWVPVTATLLTTIAAFLPMLVTTGVLGQFIKAMPIVVTLSLSLSLFESFWLLPSRLDRIGKRIRPKHESNKKDWFNDGLLPRFQRMMEVFIRFRYPVLLAFSGLLVGAFLLLTKYNKFVLFPADQTEIYLARIEMPKGTRIEVTDKVAGEIILKVKEKLGSKVAHIVSRSGVAETDPMDPKGRSGATVALATIFVTEETKNTAVTQDVLDELRSISHPAVKELSFEALINGPPIGDPINVTFRSNHLGHLSEVTNHIQQKLASTPGIFDVKIDDVYGDEEVLVNIDYEKAASLGLSLQDIGGTIRTAIAGQKLGDVNLNNREVDYFLRLDDQDRRNIADLAKLTIADQRGNLITLNQIANFQINQGSPHIKRFDFRRAKTVTANLDDNVITSVVANRMVAEEFASIQSQYKDVTMTFGGEGESTNESFQSLLSALVLSIIGIFALLVLIFKSYLRPFIILTTIPLGLVGMAGAFYLHDRPISFLALIGVIGLGGIIVNSGIVLISFIEQMREETDQSLHEILVKAAGLRLRAVIVTSLTTISGLLPTAYGLGGTDDFIAPLTLALAWGLTSGTILTIVWIPCAYAILEDYNHLMARIFSFGRKGHRDAIEIDMEAKEKVVS